MTGYWESVAWRVIWAVHETLPEGCTVEERRRAIREAYPFGPRRQHPYKVWLRAQRQYLSRYGAARAPRPEGPQLPLPLLNTKGTPDAYSD